MYVECMLIDSSPAGLDVDFSICFRVDGHFQNCKWNVKHYILSCQFLQIYSSIALTKYFPVCHIPWHAKSLCLLMTLFLWLRWNDLKKVIYSEAINKCIINFSKISRNFSWLYIKLCSLPLTNIQQCSAQLYYSFLCYYRNNFLFAPGEKGSYHDGSEKKKKLRDIWSFTFTRIGLMFCGPPETSGKLRKMSWFGIITRQELL